MTLSPTALEAAAKAAMLVRARLPGCQDEWHVLSTDPDFDDLPANADEGTPDDDITQEAVLRVCAAAITAYLAQAGKEGWVMVPRDLTPDMIVQGYEHVNRDLCEGRGNALNRLWDAMLAAAQNGGE
jgi:hypothetical protein